MRFPAFRSLTTAAAISDVATRIPLLISAPWLTKTHGQKTQAFAEAVDIFQTLADLAGIPVPESEGAQGKSLVPVMRAPADPSAAVHGVALSQFPRCWQNQTAVNGGLQVEKRSFHPFTCGITFLKHERF